MQAPHCIIYLERYSELKFPIALSIKYDYKNSIQTLGGRDAISFCYYDCLCKTEPQRLPVKA